MQRIMRLKSGIKIPETIALGKVGYNIESKRYSWYYQKKKKREAQDRLYSKIESFK